VVVGGGVVDEVVGVEGDGELDVDGAAVDVVVVAGSPGVDVDGADEAACAAPSLFAVASAEPVVALLLLFLTAAAAAPTDPEPVSWPSWLVRVGSDCVVSCDAVREPSALMPRTCVDARAVTRLEDATVRNEPDGRAAAAGGSTLWTAVLTAVPTPRTPAVVTATHRRVGRARRTCHSFPRPALQEPQIFPKSANSCARRIKDEHQVGTRWPVALVTLIEDDPRIQQAVTKALEQRGHVLHAHGLPMPALAEITAEPPDVVILDLGLPEVDGIDLLKMIRAVRDVPIIVASARDDDRDIVAALDLGADDYVVKPFSAEQLDARIRAVLRRTSSTDRPAGGPVVVGELRIDPAKREASLAGRPLDLNRKEFDVLAYLAAREGEVVSKRDLWRDVWHQAYRGTDKTIDVHLSWLRRKLGESSSAPRYLRTVRGVGVRLVAPGP
jgi:DNA-binding response OmpR family regulator